LEQTITWKVSKDTEEDLDLAQKPSTIHMPMVSFTILSLAAFVNSFLGPFPSIERLSKGVCTHQKVNNGKRAICINSGPIPTPMYSLGKQATNS